MANSCGQELAKRALEINLLHRGFLLLDGLPEFGAKNLGMLRQPQEDRAVTISRASGSLTFPANFVLVAAMNPCPCGYYGDDKRPCIDLPAKWLASLIQLLPSSVDIAR